MVKSVGQQVTLKAGSYEGVTLDSSKIFTTRYKS